MCAEEFRYQDKNVGKDINDKGSLQYLVNENFKKIDKIGQRDDKEILDAGCNVIESMINEIKRDNSMVYGEWSLGPLINLHKKFVDEYNSLTGFKLLTNNADKIYQVAKNIDNEEKETLERLRQNRTVQDSRDIVNKSKEIDKDNPMFIMEKKNGKDTGNIIFTKAANPVRIEQAVKGLFTNPNMRYIIDYSNCDTSTQKGKAIKEKMISLIGTSTCYLGYDDEQKIYTIRNQSGIISDRAYIWEGVKLIPDGLRQWHAYNEKKDMDEKIGNFNETRVENQVKNLLKDMPSANKQLNKEQQKNLIRKTEYRVNELLKKAKSLGYELESEPITKKWGGKGHMELHLISGTSEVDWTFWERIGQLGEDLSDFIDDNEGEYKTYLTNRVREKWRQMDELTKTDNVDVASDRKDENDKIIDKVEVENIIYGITKFEEMVDNFRESEGDSWMDEDDRRLVRIKTILRNGRNSLNNADDVGRKAIEKNIINPLRIEWSKFKRLSPQKNLTDKEGNRIDDPNYKVQRQYLNDVFFGNTEQQLKAIREMGSLNRRFDKTETSFVAEEIANGIEMEVENEDGTKSRLLETNDELMNKFIKNIESIFTFENDEFDNMKNSDNPRKFFIDRIYNYPEGDLDGFIKLFVENGMFPAGWESRTKDIRDLIQGKFKQLKKTLNNNIAQINSLSIEDIEKEQHKERLRLEQKEKKTEEDIEKLQGLIYLENNKQEQEKINKDALEETKLNLKYGNIDNIVKGTLFPVFAEMGGGAKGINADIYNDIKGIGNWNLSDENAKWVGDMVAEIVITVAIAVATGGAGAALMQRILKGTAKAVAKIGALAFLAPRIYRIAEVAYMGYKSLKRGGRTIKLVYSSVSLLAEGTIFNAVSTAVHSAASGTSLDGLNLNPTAQENIQTAAFLGALSLGNKAGMKVLTKLHGKTKIEAFSKAGLNDVLKNYKGIWTESLISEATAMFGAEQGMNFIFGHDVYNSETGEIEKKRSLERPTQQEWIQMIGMLLAFKMVKPQLWHNYAKKLNDGTLEICRGVKKNEVLLRDPNTGKIESLHDLINRKTGINTELRNHIDSQYNNYESSAEQKQLREHNKWREKQSKYESDILQAQEKIGEMSEYLRSDAMKKLLEAKDIVELSQEEIMEIQKEIGLTGKDVDGIFGSNSLKKLNDYINEISGNSLGEKREKLESIEEKLQFLKDNFHIDGLTSQEIEIFSKEQIAVLKQLKDLGMSVSLGKTSIELSKLTPEQISILNELKGIGINISDGTMSLSKLTIEQVENLKIIKDELGIDINGWNVEELKNLELTPEQINMLNELKGIGVDISYDIEELLKLTSEQIRILEILEGIGVNISDKVIPYSKLTIDQVTNLKRINDELGIHINRWNINQLKNLELTPEQINILNELKGIGVNIGYDIEGLSKLTPEQINILTELKGIGLDISYNVEELLKLTPEQINIMTELKGKIVNFDSKLSDYIKLSAEEKSILNSLLDLGIKIENFTGYDIYTGDVILKKISTKEIQQLQYLKDIGVDVSNFDFHQLVTICTDVNHNINSIKQLTKLGIKINAEIIKDLNNYTESEINKLTNTIENKLNEINRNILNKEKEIKKTEDELLKSKNDPRLIDNLEKTIENEKKKLEALKSIKESVYEIFEDTNMVQIEEMSKFISEFIPSRDEIRDYNKRKKEFLEKNQTLEDSDFNELFKAEGSKAKYGMSEINQLGLGYCYAYTGFELLKKSNFFDVLIKTSMKKTNNGREVKLPLGDSNGHIINVSTIEIDKKFTLKYEEEGKTIERQVSINSNSSLGFKILEIAFIKEYIISNSVYDGNPHAMQVRTEYKNTGDITITQELLHMIEGGKSSEFLEHILSKNIINSNHCLENKKTQQSLLKLVNNGNIKISPRREGSINFTPLKIENGHYDKGIIEIYGGHAYSIERTYIDSKTKENIVVIVNPHKTAEKIHIKAEDCSTLFPTRRVSAININNIFK